MIWNKKSLNFHCTNSWAVIIVLLLAYFRLVPSDMKFIYCVSSSCVVENEVEMGDKMMLIIILFVFV